jgi:predicted O-linked N-acetylglucosamine transferase (SPINDLY family)
MHDALLTPEIWHMLCHSISRVNNSVLLLQTSSTEGSSPAATPLTFPLDREAMRKSFESHGVHRERLVFVKRASFTEPAGLMEAVAAAAAADVVVDFSASSVFALAAAAPVSKRSTL